MKKVKKSRNIATNVFNFASLMGIKVMFLYYFFISLTTNQWI